MADFNALEALINAYIKQNGVQAITGQVLNGVLRGMVSALGKGWTVAGEAYPNTDPGTMTGPVAYVAHTAGTYTNFGGLVVNDGEVAFLKYNEQTWTKEVLASLAATASVDGNVGTPYVVTQFVNGVLDFAFHNMKGDPGINGTDGQDGAAAGFGTVNATVDGNVGTPGVSVQSSGPDTAKNFTFQFTNLKGETGVTSVVVTVDNTSGNPQCTASLNAGVITLAFTGLKGAQGDTGSSVDYPFTLVNNLTTNDATQALTAAMGVQLESEITQLEAEVDVLELAKSYTVEGGPSPNLFDKTTMIDGFISANYGSIGSNDGSKTSDYIPVIPGHYYLISGRTLSGVYSMRLLDENKSSSWLTPLVASTGVAYNKFNLPSEDGSSNVVNGQFKVPATAYYVQITIKYDATNGSPDTVMVTHLGDTYSANPPVPTYQPYGTHYNIKESALPQSLTEEITELQRSAEHFQKVVSPNLFNKDDARIKSGYYATNGTWYPNITNYYVSHPIFLEAGVTYKAVYPGGLGNNNTCVAIVDADNNYLNGHLTGTISGGYIIVTPSADLYASFNCGNDPTNTFMVCKQSEYPEAYTPYYKYTVLVGVSVPSTSKLVGKSVIFTGDSICQATTDDGVGGGWAKRIGDKNNMIWQNKGINGGTITDKDVVGSSFTISDTDFGTGADYIILEGGTNDADRIGSIIAGTTPTNYGSFNETGYSDNFTNDKFCGAVEYLLKRVVSSFPSARVGFIIAPKMGVSNDYTKEGNNRRAYFETIIKICRKWGVPVLNLWDECTMNPKLASHYTSGQDYLYTDGQHLTGNGYDLISPIIESWMETL